MTDLPEPMTPPDADLSTYPYMPLHWNRLRESDTWILASADEKLAALNLWCQSWRQVPAGSLPSNEILLKRHSDAGEQWEAVREHAMRGWVLCSDGRYYHAFIAELVMGVLESHGKRADQARKAAAKRWKPDAPAMPEHRQPDAPAHAPAMLQHMPEQCSGNADAHAPAMPIERERESRDKSSPPTPSSQESRESARAAEVESRNQQRPLIQAFDRAITQVYGEAQARAFPYQTDWSVAQGWFEQGVTPEDVEAVALRTLTNLHARGKTPLKSLSAITNSMIDYIADKNRPVAKARPPDIRDVDHGAVLDRQASMRRVFLETYIKTGVWSQRGGPQPSIDEAQRELQHQGEVAA